MNLHDLDYQELSAKMRRGPIEGLYGRLPAGAQKLVRKVMDAPNYDYGAMELLDAFGIEWREEVREQKA